MSSIQSAHTHNCFCVLTVFTDSKNTDFKIKERQEIDVLIEAEKEKLIDTKIELAMLKDKAKDLINKFADDLTDLQQ